MLWLLLEKPGECKFAPGFQLWALRGGHCGHPWALGGAGTGQWSLQLPRMCPWHVPLPSPSPKARGEPIIVCSGPSGPVPVLAATCPITKQQQRRLPGAEVALPGTIQSFLHPGQSSDAKHSTGRAMGAEPTPQRISSWGTRLQTAAGWETANPTPFVLNTLFSPYSTGYRAQTRACSIRALGMMLNTSSLCCP